MEFLLIVLQLVLIVVLAFGIIMGSIYAIFFGGISLIIHSIKYWYGLINKVIVPRDTLT